jgi:hypothetical protein
MANNEAGAFLNITPDVLKKLDSFDEKLEKIEKHAHTAADALKNGFGSVVIDTTKLENVITSLAKKIDAIKGNPFEGAGKGAEETTRKTISLNESLSRAADLLNRIGHNKIGEGSFANFNISGLKQGYSDLRKYVENMDLSKPQQKAAVEAMRYMKMELDEQRKTDEQRAQSAEKAAQRKEAADRRAAKAAEDARKAQEYAQRTTPQGALDYSRNTKSLQQNVQAIEYLKKARLSLNTTDANYKNTLEQINQAIARHNQALTEAGVKSQQLATRHRNLMDTAGQLSRQLALLFSVSQIEGYISKLANVRGEFELQQRSLEAILQNKAQADQIFNKTVQLAVKSPFQIKELVTFTKQLAAYRIESDKLYDTTKRLADVSAGLGVDMGRLILAYGQVKAAAYLRGTEVRQFTEAGINLYGELQRYFEEVKGEAYTTAQIVDMISKRKVTFEDIENIFKRLTDSGGLFYNMQEIQAETLQGKISNLKDSIDVMLNSIGKANEDTLKGTIDSVKVLIDNWEILAESLKGVVAILALVKLQSILTSEKMLLMAIDMGVMTKSVQKSLTLWQLLRMGLIGVNNAFKALGKAILSNIYLVALAAVAYAIKQIYDNYAEYNKALEENTKKYNENIAPINSLIAKYRELTEEANKAKAAQDKNFDAPKNRKDRENIVSQLIGKFKEYGIEENIGDVSKLTDKELENNLDRLNKKYRDLQNTILGFANAYAEVNSRSAWNPANWQDRLEGDSKNLKEAGDEMLVYSSRVTQMLDIVGAHYFDLSSKVAGYYNEVKKGPDTSKGESEVEWLLRALDALKKINAESQVVKNEFSTGKYSLFDITSSAKDFYSQKTKFEEEIDRLKIELENKSIKDPVLVSIALNQIAIDKEWSDLEKNIARKRLELPLVTPINDNKNGNDGTDTDPKYQRDILAERISLIKELNKEYEKLNKVMGSDKAAKTVMERYADSLKNVNMPKNIIGDAFLPNKQNTAKALQEISKIITDFRKKQGAINDSYQLLDSDDVENIKKQLDKTKKNIEAMFNSLDLHQKLKDAGLSEAEVQQLFPGLAKTLDDVEKEMKAAYEKNFPKGEYLVADTDANKQYLADLDKLNQQRIKEQQDLVIELTKVYKTQLSDQLQLDRWYYEERAKIAKANLTEEQKTQYEANLQKQYGKKSDENAWKQFQNSDMYISMFENIESSSTRMLEAMRDKLASLRENLKNLPADQLKAIINQQEKIDEMISQKNPFSGLTSGVKEYIQFLKQRKELEEENIRANNAVAYYTEQKNIQSNIIQQKQLEYNKEVELNGVGSAKALNLKLQLEYEKKQLDIILKKLVAEGKITEETAEQIRNGQILGKTLSDKFSEIGNNLSEFSSGITDVASNLENVFGTMSAGTADTISSIAEIASGLGQTASGVGRIMSGDVIGGGIQAIGGLAKTIGSIFNIKDKKKEREIQRQIKNVEKLQKAYDVLKEKMDLAWSAASFSDMNKQTLQNVDAQIASYQAMIKAEQDKKKTDKDRIEEWEDAIEELKKTRKELEQQAIEEMGGIGETNYKDAAQAFADAWVDAFNESEDALLALQETFDDYITNLIKKQAMMRLVQARMKSVFEAIDKSVTEGSAGGINLTKEELANIQALGESALKGLNEDLLALMETLGYTGTSAGQKAELSALTQSIQGITETTAEELAALLNSVRFFVSQQTTDISAIRTLLDARYGLETEYSDSNPMLVELRAQTGYLEILSDRIDRVFAPSANSKGAGLRVFMQ